MREETTTYQLKRRICDRYELMLESMSVSEHLD